MMVLEKRPCPPAKISYTVSCNISLHRDTKEVIYRYTQNLYRCNSIRSCDYDTAKQDGGAKKMKCVSINDCTHASINHTVTF